nr:MAG TPA: hypothetical protein [Caudoviricetes sp.]
MAYCVIPLTTMPYSTQTFKLTLEGGARNINIKLYLRYNDLYGNWNAAIYDNSTGKLLIDMLPLVCGVDLLGQFQYMDIGHAYIVPVDNTDLMMPDNNTLGTTFKLVWGDDS